MTKLIGIEKEYFVETKDGKVVTPEQMLWIPKDDCGFLAEARGEPSSDPYLAVYNLLAEEQRIINDMKTHKETKGLKLVKVPNMAFKIADVLKFYDAQMIKGKEPINNLAGTITKTSVSKKTAGIHIHFSSSMTNKVGSKEYSVSKLLDMPKIIQQLDKAFCVEIREANRPFGTYRIKEYANGIQGFEYRSLPNNINMGKLIQVLIKLEW